MASEKLVLDLTLLLPHVPDERDACVGRLISVLEGTDVDEAHVVREDGKARLCFHYDSERVGLAKVRQLVAAAGATIDKRYVHESVRIEGMDCPTCAAVIEHALGRLDGVLEAKVSYAAERLRLEYDSERSSHRAVARRIEALGYQIVELDADAGWWAEHRELVFSLVAGGLLLAGWLGAWQGAPHDLSLGLYLAAYAFGGVFTLRDAAQSLWAKRFDIDTLMLVAALGAAALGDWAEGALLLFLFNLGHALEHAAMDRARRAIEALADLAPKTALVRRDGAEVELPVEELLRGDVVIVKPGQRLAADGKVTEGNSAVNQSPVTGESVPVDKGFGDVVFAGTVNGDGVLLIEVTKLATESHVGSHGATRVRCPDPEIADPEFYGSLRARLRNGGSDRRRPSDRGAALVRFSLYGGLLSGDGGAGCRIAVCPGNRYVIQAGNKMNPARQAAFFGGVPVEVPSMTVNRVCGSGAQAIASAAQEIMLGFIDSAVAGGMENMDRAPYLMNSGRWGYRMGDGKIFDAMLMDGLNDAFSGQHSGWHTEDLVHSHHITREQQDSWAERSQKRFSAAQAAGAFAAEIAGVEIASRKGPIKFDKDEHNRPDTTLESLSKLKPAFRPEGTITAGNAPGLNTGAAAMVVADRAWADKNALEPMARLVAYGIGAVDPRMFGLGPVPAVKQALGRAGWKIGDIDRIEINEAFAAIVLAVTKDLGLSPDVVNVEGGAIAHGHPIGASGAVLTTRLLHSMQRDGINRGIVTLCIGGGQGIALAFERIG